MSQAAETEPVPFNRPYLTGREMVYLAEAVRQRALAGDGPFTARCSRWLEERTGTRRALLTHSCTAALEMAALLAGIGPGDEVIMPSFTFVSTANAFVLRGAAPVFVDIRPDTLNLDERLIEEAVTPRTRAVAVVHYGGVACEMDTILETARKHNLLVIEDAAQGAAAFYKGRALGAIGGLGALSFHETKNLVCGEGGALLVNDPRLVTAAEIIREKGTDRARFFRGEVDKYTWQMAGSSFLPGELAAAFLWAQLEEADTLTDLRVRAWERYHALLAGLEAEGLLRRPVVPPECRHNGHLYYILLAEGIEREPVLRALKAAGIGAVFHYVPLHSAPAGMRYGRVAGSMANTGSLSARLIRLPLWAGISEAAQIRVVDRLADSLKAGY